MFGTLLSVLPKVDNPIKCHEVLTKEIVSSEPLQRRQASVNPAGQAEIHNYPIKKGGSGFTSINSKRFLSYLSSI
jgi:hypothetical protein